MCEECLNFICPGNCPDSDDYSAEFGECLLHCSVCDSPLYSDDEYICADDEVYCSDCIEDLGTDDILRLCNSSSVCELLAELGLKLKKA